MKRKIEEKLISWKNSSNRKPLIVHGARQVGKTYSVLEFGNNQYDSVAYFDFSAQADLSKIFAGDITPQRLIPQLQVLYGHEIKPKKTLIFFDEIQTCPRALTSLKYFCEQAADYDVIAAGSLLGVSLRRKEHAYPVGKADMLELYPLDFEEYLWAKGETKLGELIREAFCADEVFGLHGKAMDLYREYLLVGGMPEAILTYNNAVNINSLRHVQENLLNAYLADMTKYSNAQDSAKILSVWRGIPEQLAKCNHKFQYSTISSSARAYQYESSLDWLTSAGLVMPCFRVSEGARPLRAFAEHDFFKLYLLDVGLLSCNQGMTLTDILPSDDKDARVRGGLCENYVMQQMVSAGMEPFYWGTASKAEVDFVVQRKSGNIVPIEVKSGDNVRSSSLGAFKAKYAPELSVRVSSKNFGMDGGIKSIPLYAAFCLSEL